MVPATYTRRHCGAWGTRADWRSTHTLPTPGRARAVGAWRIAVQLWQWVLLAFVVVIPFALMLDFWGDQRVGPSGRPRPRDFRPSPPPAPEPPDSH